MKLLPIFLLASIICFGQDKNYSDQKRDSIVYYLESSNDSLKLLYLKRAVLLSEEIRNDSLLTTSSIKYAESSFFRRDSLETLKSLKNLWELFAKKKDSLALAKFYHIRAMLYKRKIKLDSAFYYYQQSKNISLLKKDSIQVGRRLLSMGLMQVKESDLLGAETSLIEALKYLEPLKENRYTGNTYNNLGLVLIELKRYEEARVYFEKSKNLHESNKNQTSREKGFLDYFNNTGFSYVREGKFSEAIPYLEEGLRSFDVEQNYTNWHQALLGNLADCLYQLDRKKEAWSKYLRLLEIRKEKGNLYGQSLSHNGLAELYMIENKRVKALFHANEGYKFAKHVNNNATTLSALLKLGELTSGNKSKEYYQKYVQLGNRLNNRERYLKDQFARVRYETEKTEKENITLKIDNDRQAAAVEKAEQQRIIGWLVAIALFLTLGLSVTFYKNRRKKLLYESQLEKANAREQERQQIAKSLHDEVAGDLRMLHQKLAGSNQQEEANGLEKIKENVRNLSHQLSSVSFEEVSFKDQMINLATDYFSKDFKVFVKGLDLEGWEEVNETIKRTLYLSVRESLQNALRYAEASRFDILFSLHKKEVLVSAKDNGKGFKTTKEPKGIGLKNIEERVQELQGSLAIESSNEGTEIQIRIPRNGK